MTRVKKSPVDRQMFLQTDYNKTKTNFYTDYFGLYLNNIGDFPQSHKEII